MGSAVAVVVVVAAFALATGAWAAAPFPPERLHVNSFTNPLGVEAPEFGWHLPAFNFARGFHQSAYQIQVGLHPTLRAPFLWDTDVVAGSFSAYIKYAGAPLKSNTVYYWHVRFFDNFNVPSNFSEVNFFETGLLAGESDWAPSQWIGAANSNENLVRHTFVLPNRDNVVRARAFIAGIGYYELHLNGEVVGDHKLDVAWTTYERRVVYSTYDVTRALKAQDNAVGVMLGRGWFSRTGYGDPIFRLQLIITLSDGVDVVVSSTDNGKWTSSVGPITYDDVYNGENYDARLEQDGWDTASFDPSTWTPITNGSTFQTAVLSSQLFEPITVIRHMPAFQMTQPRPGMYIYDFDQNFSGFCRLRVTGPAGTRVQLRFAEILQHDGSGLIYTDNLRSARATDVYILKGDPNGEVYEPRFTYHGFRYVELTGLPTTPDLFTLEGIHIRSSVEETGNVVFSHQLLNQIQHNIVWGQSTNLMSVPTDCDQRDERRGWTGDAALSSGEAQMNFHMSQFHRNFLDLLNDVQTPNGTIPDVVPVNDYLHAGPSDPAWGTVYPTLAYFLMKNYGDLAVVRKHWTGLQRYLNWLDTEGTADGLAHTFAQFGDWVPPPPAPKVDISYTGAFSFLLDIDHMIEMALNLGETVLVQKYKQMLAARKAEFHAAFYNSQTHCYADCGQTAIACALYLGIPPTAEIEQEQVDKLVHDVMVTNNGHLTSGIIGWKFILPVLTRYGRSDVAFTMLSKTDYPSFGYQILHPLEPATTIWELWDSDKEGPGMNSRDHIMFGTTGEWFYTDVAGFGQLPTSIGFAAPVITPDVYGFAELSWFSMTKRLPRGEFSISWSLPGAYDACGSVDENNVLTLSCVSSEDTIVDIAFASFGNPTGTCLSGFAKGSCDAANSTDVVRSLCLNNSTCTIQADDTLFGDPCYGTVKTLAVGASCMNEQGVRVQVTIPPGVAGISVIRLPKSNQWNNGQVAEGGHTIFRDGAFVPGADGVVNALENIKTVDVQVVSGTYKFVLSQ